MIGANSVSTTQLRAPREDLTEKEILQGLVEEIGNSHLGMRDKNAAS